MIEQPLFRSSVLELAVTRSGGRLSVEVRDGGGATVATADDGGTIADPFGQPLLLAPIGWEGRRDKGTSAKIDVSDASGAPLGQAKVEAYSAGPRAQKVTLSVRDPSGELARLEPQDRKGGEIAIQAAGARAGTLQQTAHKRGLFRGSTTWRLELTGPLDERPRQLVVVAAIRYQKLAQAAANAASID